MKIYGPGASLKSDYYSICNNCQEDDGRQVLTWNDFALCFECIRSLYVEYVSPIDKINEKIIVKRTKISEKLRNKLLKEYGNKCPRCGCKDRTKLEIDHIIPFSLNGTTEKHNLSVLCKSCNATKGNRLEKD